MLLIIKSRHPDEPEKIPLPEKLRLILNLKIKEAKTDEERERAQRELEKFQNPPER